MGYEQILFEADKISTVRGDDIEVLPEVDFGRDALQAKLGWGRNDPKVGVRNFTINGPNIHVCLATGIYATDNNLCMCVRAWPGQCVQTPYGQGIVIEIKPYGCHVIKSTTIKSMYMYLHPSCVTLLT